LRTAAIAGLAVVLGSVLWFALKAPPVHGDSAVLVRSSRLMVDCVEHGHLTNCNAHTAVGPYAFLQFIPAIPLRAAGVSTESTLRVLVAISFVSLLAILGLSYRTVRRLAPPMWAPLVVATLLTGPLLWYGKSAFSEMLAAAIILGATVAVLLDARLAIIAVFVALACVTKETNPPFILVLTVICAYARPGAERSQPRRQLYAIAIGTATGIVVNALFNVFRYGTPRNTAYLHPGRQTTDPPIVGRLFAAQWFSPNGGLLWFWPLAVVLLTASAVLVLRRGPNDLQRFAAPIVAGLLVLQVAVLSTWWAPFGWYAWGPRLVLPLIPALLVAAVVLGASRATLPIARILRSWVFWPLAALAVAAGLPQAVTLSHGTAVTDFFAGSQQFCPTSSVIDTPDRYYHCLTRIAWSKRPWMLQVGMHGLDTLGGYLVAIAFGVAVVALLLLARRAAQRPAAATRETAVQGSVR